MLLQLFEHFIVLVLAKYKNKNTLHFQRVEEDKKQIV